MRTVNGVFVCREQQKLVFAHIIGGEITWGFLGKTNLRPRQNYKTTQKLYIIEYIIHTHMHINFGE